MFFQENITSRTSSQNQQQRDKIPDTSEKYIPNPPQSGVIEPNEPDIPIENFQVLLIDSADDTPSREARSGRIRTNFNIKHTGRQGHIFRCRGVEITELHRADRITSFRSRNKGIFELTIAGNSVRIVGQAFGGLFVVLFERRGHLDLRSLNQRQVSISGELQHKIIRRICRDALVIDIPGHLELADRSVE